MQTEGLPSRAAGESKVWLGETFSNLISTIQTKSFDAKNKAILNDLLFSGCKE
jgi:hypothetical protein